MFLSTAIFSKPVQKIFSNPREVLRDLPGVAIKPISYAPFVFQKTALTKVLFKLFEENLSDGDMDFLKGHWLALEVSDANLSMQFSCGPNREVLIRKQGLADASIRGNLKSFIFLAARKEDPDTLFFQRDLVIEGDTNIGLEVKNLMDSLDLEQLPPELTFGVRCAAEYMDVFC